MSDPATRGDWGKGTKKRPKSYGLGRIKSSSVIFVTGCWRVSDGRCRGNKIRSVQEFAPPDMGVVVTFPDLWATTFTFFRLRFL